MKPIFVISFWSMLYLIPVLGIRSKHLPWGLVWIRYKKFLPYSMGLALFAGITGAMMSGTVGAVGSLMASLLSTTWLFLVYVNYKVAA